MSENNEKRTRKKSVAKAEMAELNRLLKQLVERMEQAIAKLDDEGLTIDGWDSAWRGAELVRTQYSKIIGEVNLQDVKFERRSEDSHEPGSLAAESHAEYETKTKASRRSKKREQ